MADVATRENDLILSQTEFAFIQDTAQSGRVTVYVGPRKDSLGQTDSPVRYNPDTKRYDKCNLKDAVRPWIYADEQSYVVLENPAADDKFFSPELGKGSQMIALNYGKTVNIRGPVTFPLWPGQDAQVITGHQIRSNQYLVTRDLDGKLNIIRGTETPFYIPPTGTQVVEDEKGRYVREALTLERLEYCILKDENGKKRYVNGPAVVFPEPTETFISDKNSGSIKFMAIELNENMGIHIKVISDYTEPMCEATLKVDGTDTPAATGVALTQYRVGDELFITGSQQRIYFPREEHAIVKYGDNQIRLYAVAVPKGEARYVLDKTTGEVKTIKGPTMLLPDPRKEVIIKRVMSQKEISLFYPGNREAMEYNASLSQLEKNEAGHVEDDSRIDSSVRMRSVASAATMYASKSATLGEMSDMKFADTVKRGTKFTPPRTITLDSKYEGAVLVNVWPGYAVQVVSKTGERSVVIGPKSVTLDYDQTLERLALSTGKPKTTDKLYETVYLCIKDNKVGDIIDHVETSDMVSVAIKLSYVVNFEGEPTSWFTVENYVKLLTDNLRSIIRNTVKKHGIEEINKRGIDIIRNMILGDAVEGKRPGRTFSNGMRVCDVEVLDLVIGDQTIDRLMHDAQMKAVTHTITVETAQKELAATQTIEAINRKKIIEKLETSIAQADADTRMQMIQFDKNKAVEEAKNGLQTLLDSIARAELERRKAANDEELRVINARVAAETGAYVERYKAVTPELIAAINSLGQNQLATALVQHLPEATGTNGLLFGAGGMEGLMKMVSGTPIEKALKGIGVTMDKVADKID